jgi:putative zinc finger protein
MEHDEVVEQDVASRYLGGELPLDERAAFEEHLIDCPRCLDALEGADELQRGLRTVAAQDALTNRRESTLRPSRAGTAIMAAAGIAAAIAIVIGTADVVGTRRELARVARISTDLNAQADRAQSLIRSLSDRVQQLESAAGRGAAAPGAAQASAPVFALATVRGGGTSTPPNRVTLAGAPEWIVLALELDGPYPADRYRAILTNASQSEVWRDDRLVASTPETLAIALRAALLDEGDFTLAIDRQAPHTTEWISAGRYAFRVVRSR